MISTVQDDSSSDLSTFQEFRKQQINFGLNDGIGKQCS